jgi:DNA-binding MarR family transcriptional regulator
MIETIEPQKILTIIDGRGTFQSNELAEELGIDHQKLVGAIKSLQAQDGVSQFLILKLK